MATREVLILETPDDWDEDFAKNAEDFRAEFLRQLQSECVVVLPAGYRFVGKLSFEVPDGPEKRGPLTVIRRPSPSTSSTPG